MDGRVIYAVFFEVHPDFLLGFPDEDPELMKFNMDTITEKAMGYRTSRRMHSFLIKQSTGAIDEPIVVSS